MNRGTHKRYFFCFVLFYFAVSTIARGFFPPPRVGGKTLSFLEGKKNKKKTNLERTTTSWREKKRFSPNPYFPPNGRGLCCSRLTSSVLRTPVCGKGMFNLDSILHGSGLSPPFAYLEARDDQCRGVFRVSFFGQLNPECGIRGLCG